MGTGEPHEHEVERILHEYRRRAAVVPDRRYHPIEPSVLFMIQVGVRHLLEMLRADGVLPLEGRRLLEVGCGRGAWLSEFESWGVARRDLAGIELDPERAEEARARLCAYRASDGRELTPGADIRSGDASRLPWTDGSFDLVMQATVFTSILDGDMRRAIASEMVRVLRPGGVIVWYDFFYDNPRNRAVRGVSRHEIGTLFPDASVKIRRVALAPPIARALVPVSWLAAELLESLRVLNTHYLALIRPAGTVNPEP